MTATLFRHINEQGFFRHVFHDNNRDFKPRTYVIYTPVVFSGFSRRVARIFPEVRSTFSTKSGNLYEAKRTKRGWVSLMVSFWASSPHCFCVFLHNYLSFALFCSFFLRWNKLKLKPSIFPLEIIDGVKKNEKPDDLLTSRVTALRFTRALSPGPGKQEKTSVNTGSRGDVFVVRTSKPVENLWKNGLFWSRLIQFRYTFYRPQTKRSSGPSYP